MIDVEQHSLFIEMALQLAFDKKMDAKESQIKLPLEEGKKNIVEWTKRAP